MSSEPAQCFLFGQPGISEPALSKPRPGHLDATRTTPRELAFQKRQESHTTLNTGLQCPEDPVPMPGPFTILNKAQ
jgi:hypothetical protein